MKSKQADEGVVREFPPVAKYRIRILKGHGSPSLDVREYVSTDSFEGYTRRGIRLTGKAQVNLLGDILKEALEAME